MTARLILPPGAPEEEWLAARRAGVTASEIAMILGISPWGSSYNLYWRKLGVIPDNLDSERLSLGRHMEPWVAERFQDEHPDLSLSAPAGLWANTERPWQLATPDGLVYDGPSYGVVERDGVFEVEPLAVWEGKTSGTYEGWGEDGSDEIPAYYAAQVQWQMDVLDVRKAYVSCFFLATQRTRHYVIGYDEADVELTRKRGLEFWERVRAEDPPELDSHDATLAALKYLYPDAEAGEKAEVPNDLAIRYRNACAAVKRAEERKTGIEVEIRAAMGNAKYAIDADGQKVATRSVYDRKGYEVKPTRIDALKPATTSKKKEDAA